MGQWEAKVTFSIFQSIQRLFAAVPHAFVREDYTFRKGRAHAHNCTTESWVGILCLER